MAKITVTVPDGTKCSDEENDCLYFNAIEESCSAYCDLFKESLFSNGTTTLKCEKCKEGSKNAENN